MARKKKSKRPPKLDGDLSALFGQASESPDADASKPAPGKRGKKRGKRAAQPAARAQQDEALAFTPFASKLKPLQAEITRAEREQAQRALEATRARREVLQQAETQGRNVVARQALVEGDVVEMSEDELFAKAVDGLNPVQIERGKFAGQGPETRHVRLKEERRPAPKEIEALAPPEDPYHDEAAVFEEMMDLQGIQPIENPVYTPDIAELKLDTEHLVRFKQDDHSRAFYRQQALEALLDDDGPVLNSDQRKLLKAAQTYARNEGPLQEITIRGARREVALRQLELMAMQASVTGVRFVRVITGKGLGSAGEPVLKIALVEWCLGHGADLVRGYAPEIQPDGDFGTFILHIRRQRR